MADMSEISIRRISEMFDKEMSPYTGRAGIFASMAADSVSSFEYPHSHIFGYKSEYQ